MSRKRLEIHEELPPLVPFFQRFRASHLVLGQEVELRLARKEDSARPESAFRRDLVALSWLDSPAFLPVLDRARFQGRLFSAHPLRSAPTLAEVREDHDFTLSQRCGGLRSLARGLSQAHQKGISLGGIDPGRIAWDGELQWAYFLSTQQGEGSLTQVLQLPEGSEELSPLERDVVSWGALAYWLLARVSSPRSGGMLVPACARVRELHPELGEVVDGCLDLEGEGRPENGVELAALLAMRSLDLRVQGGRSSPEEEHSVQESLQELRSRDELPRVEPFDWARRMDFDFDLGERFSRLGAVTGRFYWWLGGALILLSLVLGLRFWMVREPDPFEVFDQLERMDLPNPGEVDRF